MPAFTVSPPDFSAADLAQIAKDVFGLSGTVDLLVSERDRNGRISAGNARYVLKIANAAEDPAQLDIQNAAMVHLRNAGFVGCPTPVPALSGELVAHVPRAGRSHMARLVSWVDGDLLSSVPRSTTQLRNLGGMIGQLSRGLQGFGHPAAFRPDFLWSLDHVSSLRPMTAAIADPARRRLVESLFDRYDAKIAPRLPGLRASVLHQDANDNNIIVERSDPETIIGLIDFGDMAFGRTINELAITLAYALLDTPDIYAAIRALVGGYVAQFPISEDEAELLYDLARLRLAASVCISSQQSRMHPENQYILISQQPAFALLERLAQIDPEFMVAVCRNAAGFSATRAEPAVRAYLAAVTPASLFEPDIARSARLALPTGGQHPDMPAFSDRAFDVWFRSQRPMNLPADLPFYGLGAYGENRSVYATAQYADAASAERRTCHMGIDVFAPAGTPVHAPLAGTIVSLTYNADPLDYGHTLILAHQTHTGETFWTLYGHLGEGFPAYIEPGYQVAEGEQIAVLGDWDENGGWAPHLHFQVMTSMLSQSGNFFGVGHLGLWDVWSGICIDPNLITRLEPQSFTLDSLGPDALLARRAKVLGPSMSVSYADKLKMVGGQGPYLIDHTGRKYLDGVNNITHVGHCHPHIVAALSRQAATLNTNTRYLSELILDYSERLTATLPGQLRVAYFVNSGTEANELALRIARTAIGKKDTVVLDWAYHGNSGGMVEISPYKFKRRGGFPKRDFVEIAEFPDPYRGRYKGMSANTAQAYAADVERCLDLVEARTGSAAATFIAESISGVGGQVVYPPGYLQAVYAQVHRRGGICIADEVQCGFGRVGSQFWGFQLQHAVPDIVIMGKPIGNGHPLAAVVTTPELAAHFANGMEYFNSFGGNPVSMAVGMAVLDVLEREGLQAAARQTGDYLLAMFGDMAKRHAIIGDVRGAGLFLGIELVTDRHSLKPATAAAGWIVNQMRQRGVLVSTDGPLDNVLKFKPPMVFGRAEADILCQVLGQALSDLPQDVSN